MDLRRSIPAAMMSSFLGGARIAQRWLTASDFHAGNHDLPTKKHPMLLTVLGGARIPGGKPHVEAEPHVEAAARRPSPHARDMRELRSHEY